MNKSIFIIAAEFGDSQVTEKFKAIFLDFKRILENSCKSTYSDEILEISFIFRIDGRISAWGDKGCNRMRLMRKRNYITIDLGITSEIIDLQLLDIWDFVWREFSRGLNMMLRKIKSQKIFFEEEQLINDLLEQVPDHIAGKDYDGNLTSHYFDFNHLWQAAEVVVYKSTYNSRGIFGTTIHELSHASHWEMSYSTYQYVSDWFWSEPKVPESWAVGVEWKITNDIYPSAIYGNHQDYQDYTIAGIITGNYPEYTPLAIDLMDNINQRLDHSGNMAYANDQVEGYTLSQLEQALRHSDSWGTWRSRIKEMFDNPTEVYVDYLFQIYN